MGTTIVTQKGQTLDDIVFQVYGDRPQMLTSLTETNSHVLGLGIRLPAGVTINLPPVLETPKTVKTVNLWD